MELRDISKEIEQVAGGYQYQEPPPGIVSLRDILEQGLRYLADLLSSWHLPTLGLADSRLASNILQFFWYAAAFAACGVLAVLLARQMSAAKGLSKNASVKSTIIKITTAADWRKQAEQLARQGQFKEASRAIYLSLLRQLHETGVIPFAAHKTNYEYLQMLSGSGHLQLQSAFRQIVMPFENIWFGNLQASDSDYHQMSRDLDQLVLQLKDLPAKNKST